MANECTHAPVTYVTRGGMTCQCGQVFVPGAADLMAQIEREVAEYEARNKR